MARKKLLEKSFFRQPLSILLTKDEVSSFMLKKIFILLLSGIGLFSQISHAEMILQNISSDQHSNQVLSQTSFFYGINSKRVEFGVDNMKPAILGILYRGGSNGTRNKSKDKDSGTLRKDQLISLCQAGFSTVVYAYGANKNIIPTIDCQMTDGRPNTLKYLGVKYSEKEKFVEIIDDVIRNKKGPVYDHCWNGFHASGELAAIALMQFCDFSSVEAAEYWDLNQPNKTLNMTSLKNRIKQFKPINSIAQLNSADREAFCPTKPKTK